jgi:hypothetical protein
MAGFILVTSNAVLSPGRFADPQDSFVSDRAIFFNSAFLQGFFS